MFQSDTSHQTRCVGWQKSAPKGWVMRILVGCWGHPIPNGAHTGLGIKDGTMVITFNG